MANKRSESKLAQNTALKAQIKERKKELCFLKEVTDLAHQKLNPALLAEKVLANISASMQFPDHTHASVKLLDFQVHSPNFNSNFRYIEYSMMEGNKCLCEIVVAYDDEVPDTSRDPFLPEERSMLETACKILALDLESEEIQTNLEGMEKKYLQVEQVVNRSPAVAFIWELTKGWPVKFVSENINQFGFSREQFESGEIFFEDIIFPADLNRVANEVESHLSAEKTHFIQEYRILNSSNEIRWIKDLTYIDQDIVNNTKYAQGLIIDVTETVQAERLSRKYLDTTDNIFLVVDPDGKVLDANQRISELVEVSLHDLIGSNWIKNHVAPEDLEKVSSYYSSSIKSENKERQHYSNKIISLSGKEYFIEWNFTFEFNSRGEVVSTIAFGRNITDEIKEKNRAYTLSDLLMENPNPIMRIDRSGDVILANTAAHHLLEVIPNNQSDVDSWQALINAAKKAKLDNAIDVEFSDKTYLFLLIPVKNNNHINIYGADVSEQKEVSSKLNAVARNFPGAMFEYVLSADGSDAITFMNPGCENLWGVSADQVKNDTELLWNVILPEDLPAMRQSVLDSAVSLDSWAHEWRINTADGQIKWLNGIGTPLRRNDGSTSWTTIILDVTEQRLAKDAVSDALRQTIYVLSAALEARDPYTAGHEENVAKIALSIGRSMGLDKHVLIGLEMAGVIHDVGKIQIPAEILSKPSRLTEIEFEFIKQHPVTGANLLKGVNFEWPIADMIRQHHERWDGSGYPDGLKGEEILLEARILGVADTLEAMSSHRPYRSALGLKKACEEIREGAGVRYDPEVANVCLELAAKNQLGVDLPR